MTKKKGTGGKTQAETKQSNTIPNIADIDEIFSNSTKNRNTKDEARESTPNTALAPVVPPKEDLKPSAQDLLKRIHHEIFTAKGAVKNPRHLIDDEFADIRGTKKSMPSLGQKAKLQGKEQRKD